MVEKKEAEIYYRRYTDLPSLIHILKNLQLTLLDPQLWEDKNDSYFITVYKNKCKLKSVLALCLSASNKTFHHWSVFSPGPSGISIRFNAKNLEKSIKGVSGLKLEPVKYLTISELRKTGKIKKERLPFLKRSQFQPENEIRLLWESKDESLSTFEIPLELNSISRITLSPWLHLSLANGIRSLLKTIDGCDKLKIYRSTLIHNSDWMKYGDMAI